MVERRGCADARTTEATLRNERMGLNALQGDDQERVRNERRVLLDEKPEADSLNESFDKLEKHQRARDDRGKGARGR